LKLFPDGHISPRRRFCISFDFVFAAVLIFHVVKMVMVVGVARSIHLTLILLRLLGSTCAMASSSFFTRFFSYDFHLSLSLSCLADPNSSLYRWNLAVCFDWSDKCCECCVLTCLLIIIELLVFLDLEELLVGFVRHLMLLMASKQGAPILPVPLESSLTMVIHSFPLVSDCVWDCSQGFTCKVELLLGSCHVVKFFNVWFAFL
jgi:hypothetical protein